MMRKIILVSLVAIISAFGAAGVFASDEDHNISSEPTIKAHPKKPSIMERLFMATIGRVLLHIAADFGGHVARQQRC